MDSAACDEYLSCLTCSYHIPFWSQVIAMTDALESESSAVNLEELMSLLAPKSHA